MKTKLFLGVLLGYIIFNFFVTGQAGKKALYDMGEARSAEIAKQYLKTGNWLIPSFDSRPELSTPPLETWIIAGSYRIFGINELAVRLPSLLFALGVVIVSFLLIRQLGISDKTNLIALTAVVLSSDFYFLSTQGVTEMQLLFFCMLCMYLTGRGVRNGNNKIFALAGLSLGLALMTDYISALWVFVPVLYYLIAKKMTLKNTGILFGTALAVAIPWAVYIAVHYGRIAIGNIALEQSTPFYWYGIYMIDSWRPLVFVLPFLVTLSLKDKVNQFLALWALAVIVSLSLVPSKVWWFVFPAMIPLTVLAVRAVKNRPALAFFALVIGSLPVWQLQYALLLQQVAMFGFIFFGLVFMALRNHERRSRIQIPPTLILTLFIIFTLGVQERQSMKYTDRNKDLKLVLAKYRGKLPNMAVYKLPHGAALFYSDMDSLTDNARSAEYVLVERNTVSELTGFRRLDQSGRMVLLKKAP